MGIIKETIEGKVITLDIDSSNLKGASYNNETQTLTITFNNGGKYEYYKVPMKIFIKFQMSESQGKFFSSEIRAKYDFKKV
jgi:hypothetical protein